MLKPKMELGSEEHILEQLSVTEQKLVNLAEELASRDLDTIQKEMEDKEVNVPFNALSCRCVEQLWVGWALVPPHSGERDSREHKDCSTQGTVQVSILR